MTKESYSPTQSLNNAFSTSLVQEVQRLSEKLAKNPLQSSQDVEDARIVYHTFSGLFSMVGLNDLSQIAMTQEMSLDESQTVYSTEAFLRRVEKVFTSSLKEPSPETFSILVKPLTDHIAALAESLGKKLRPITVKGGDDSLPEKYKGKMLSLLNHLLVNAVDHGIESPAERLRAGKDESGSIEIALTPSPRSLKLKIEDDGGGIEAPADIKLFDFGYTTKSSVTEISGRGIGLHAVQKMVHELGGTIELITSKGRGTSFILRFPVPDESN